MLQVNGLRVSYGEVEALHGVDLKVGEGEIVAVIGPNGAGKTTLMHAISGLIRPTAGQVLFRGKDITNWRPNQIVRLGLAHVPQGRGIFADQSVKANLLLGAYSLSKKEKIPELMNREYARFPILEQRSSQLAGLLSGGEAQMLAISRALMSEPRFLALDEPSLGLAPLIVKEVIRTIKSLNEAGMTILVVEQMAMLVLSIAHRAYVLQQGRVVLSGTGAELKSDPELINSYLGEARQEEGATVS